MRGEEDVAAGAAAADVQEVAAAGVEAAGPGGVEAVTVRWSWVAEWPYVCKKTPQKLVVAGLHSALRGRESALLFQKGRTLRRLLQEREVGGCFTATRAMVASGIYRSLSSLSVDVRETVADGSTARRLVQGLGAAIRNGHLGMAEWLLCQPAVVLALEQRLAVWEVPAVLSRVLARESNAFSCVAACFQADWEWGTHLMDTIMMRAGHPVMPVMALLAAARAGTERSVGWLDVFWDRLLQLSDGKPVSLARSDSGIGLHLLGWAVSDTTSVQAMEWLVNHGATGDVYMWVSAGRHGRFDILEFLCTHLSCSHARGSSDTSALPGLKAAVDEALCRGQLHVYDWIASRQLQRLAAHHAVAFACGCAARRGELGMLERLLGTLRGANCEQGVRHATKAASQTGQLHVIEYLRPLLHCDAARHCASNAARGGHIAVLEYLQAQGLLDRATASFSDAAKMGRLAVLKWLHAEHEECRGQQAMSVALDHAAAQGHLDVVCWLHALRADLGQLLSSHLDSAVDRSHWPAVEWFLEQGVRFRRRSVTGVLEEAVAHGSLSMAEWLHHTVGADYSNRALHLAAARSDTRLVRLILQHNPGAMKLNVLLAAAPRMKLDLACQWMRPWLGRAVASAIGFVVILTAKDILPDAMEVVIVLSAASSFTQFRSAPQWMRLWWGRAVCVCLRRKVASGICVVTVAVVIFAVLLWKSIPNGLRV